MISPQNLTVACAAVGLPGREPWTVGLLLVIPLTSGYGSGSARSPDTALSAGRVVCGH